MAESGGDKKHEATEFRKQQARKKGQIAKSKDLASAVLLLITVLVLKYATPLMYLSFSKMLTRQLSGVDPAVKDSATVINNALGLFQNAALAVAPLFAVSFLSAFIVNIAQTGILFLPDKIKPDINHINPVSGVKRIFSLQNLTSLGFGLAKIALIGFIMVVSVWMRWDEILSMGRLTVAEAGSFMWSLSLDIVQRAALVLVALALADFAFQRWKISQDLRMTDEELREEIKNNEGDPQIKQRRRQVQRQLMAQRVEADVPKADVVITNPTHLAIAIAYEPMKMAAPIVIAKGADSLAQRIRKVALEHSIPVIERKPLARALFESVDVGAAVPVEQYAAVAEVLKYVYQAEGRSLDDLNAAVAQAKTNA